MEQRTVVDWGQAGQVAPSIKRADAWGWVVSSALLGVLACFVALAALWRPLPLLASPPWSLPTQIGCVVKAQASRSLGSYKFEARQCESAMSQLGDDQVQGIRARVALALIAFFVPGALLARSAFEGSDGLTHLRGSTRSRGEAAVKALNAALAKRVKRRPDHEIAPGVPYPSDMWTRHVLVVGGVGSGKSTAIKPLLAKIEASGEQMLLFDPKSEFTMGFAKPKILAPWDARSLSWDLAKDMRNSLDMRRFAASMIKESQDPMWSNASRQLLVGLMIYLKRTRGADWGWRELSDLIALPQDSLLSIMKRFHPEAIRAVEKASVTTAGILINLASFCSSIFDLAEAWGEVPKNKRISFVEWTQGRSPFKQVILQGHGAYGELTKAYVEAVIGVVSAMVNSVEMVDDPNRKIWFIADEFAQMGKVPVRPLFEVGRSRGVRCVVACQDFAQLQEVYGEPMVKALVGMCGTLLVGQVMQGETAESLCKAFGSREVERANYSSSFGSGGGGPGAGKSTTLSFNRDEVPLYKPSELTSRLGLNREGTAVTLLLFTGGHAYELDWPLFEIKRAREPHVPAAWTLGCGPDASIEATAKALPPVPQPVPPPAAASAPAEPGSSSLPPGSGVIAESASAKSDPADSGARICDALKELEEMIDGTGASGQASSNAGQGSGGGAKSSKTEHANDGGIHGSAVVFVAPPTSPTASPVPPKIAVEVFAAPEPSRISEADRAEEPEAGPMFDALAELAAAKLGVPALGTGMELASSIDSSRATSDAPAQAVRLAPASLAGPDR